MKKFAFLLIIALLLGMVCGCVSSKEPVQIAATTLPVYEFTSRICQGTGISVGQLVTDNVSCLHEYSLQVSQMRMIESAQVVVVSGLGLESFLDDALIPDKKVIDASEGISPICLEDAHEAHHNHGHSHEEDPHIWLSPANAKIMAQNICNQLSSLYPDHKAIFSENASLLYNELDTLASYGEESLSSLKTTALITFHDGFAYFADSFGLTILEAMEEESGREASAAQLKELITLVKQQHLPAVFVEINGSVSAADVIAAETGCKVYPLDMAMSGDSYFDSMYYNIDIIKEALG